ncbi:Cytochrome c [Planctomycetes bacterium Pan216]|uniref:Cytochrome c n=1 Tax=Kolteria novifilia TaxID=2527975 RepID=A0A518B6P0_9BACT|nr:Cytochrome c [Planctomycetes bacterium Pan216]
MRSIPTLLAATMLGLCATSAHTETVSKTKPPATNDPFDINVWAEEPMVVNPTTIDVDSRGRVWVTEGLNYRFFRNKEYQKVPGADRIKILEDTDGDGKADKVTVFAEDIFPVPMGLAIEEIWKDGKYAGARVYTGNSPDVLLLEDTDGDDKADKRRALLSGFGGHDHDHGVHGMAFGPDGKLYFTKGDSQISKETAEKKGFKQGEVVDVVDASGRHLRANDLGTLLRVNPDGTNLEILGTRYRNNYETAVDSFGNVFVSDNDDDGNRGVRMVWNMDGGNHGYRTPGSRLHWGEEIPGIVPKLVGTGNGSPCGIMIYEGDLLPKELHGAAMQVDAGTRTINTHPLVRQSGTFRTGIDHLIEGTDALQRPVDVVTAPDGSLFIADWFDAGVGGHRFTDQKTGRIYHLAPKGHQTSEPKPDFASIKGQLEALASPNPATRLAGRTLLIERGAKARPALQELFKEGTPPLRARALFALADLPETGRGDVIAALKDDDPQIREAALRILARDVSAYKLLKTADGKVPPPPALEVLDEILPLADDPDPGVRRELILALRRVPTEQAGEALRKLTHAWDGRDRYTLEALRLALRERDSAYLTSLLQSLADEATKQGWESGPVALPPYYPVTTNESFPAIGESPLPANGASKLIGLAWSLGRPEAIDPMGTILEKNDAPRIVGGADIAFEQIDDPRAAELLLDRFLAIDDPNRQREILRLLGSRLAGPWKAMRDSEKSRKAFSAALDSPELRVEAIRALARAGMGAYAPQLLALAKDDKQELSTRAAAIEALGRLKHQPAGAMAEQFLAEAEGERRSSPLAFAALSALTSLKGSEGAKTLQEIIVSDDYPLDLKRRAIPLLASDRKNARRLMTLYKEKKLPEELGPEVSYTLLNHPDRGISRQARSELGGAAGAKTAGGKQLVDMRRVLQGASDATRGRAVFARERSDACIRCHRVQGVGNWVGPDLSSIGTKYGKKELLYHILNPSGAIGYDDVAWTLALADGRVLTGLITDETADGIVLKTALGERMAIPNDDIDEKVVQTKSLMPENLVESMTEQDIADLLAYLSTLKVPVSEVGQYHLLGPLSAGSYDATAPVDLEARVKDGTGRETGWREVTSSRDKFLDLSTLLGSAPGKEVYLHVPVIASRAETARLVLTTDAAISAWVNGKPLELSRETGKDKPGPFEANLDLRGGPNDLVIRVPSGSVNTGLVATIVSQRGLRFGFGAAALSAK